MASPLNYKIIIFLLVVDGYILHATSTLLEEVCEKSRDIEFCLNVFGSDPATRTNSLPELGRIAIDKATDKATKVKMDIDKRIFFAFDPKLKDLLTQCSHRYNDALAALRIAPKDLREAHYTDLYRHANDAGQGAVDCQQAFIDASVNSPITRDNVQMHDYCNIVQIIAKFSW